MIPSQKPSLDDLHIAGVRPVPGRTLDHKTGVFHTEMECMVCHTRWLALQSSRGYINSTYWQCPKGCNRP